MSMKMTCHYIFYPTLRDIEAVIFLYFKFLHKRQAIRSRRIYTPKSPLLSISFL